MKIYLRGNRQTEIESRVDEDINLTGAYRGDDMLLNPDSTIDWANEYSRRCTGTNLRPYVQNALRSKSFGSNLVMVYKLTNSRLENVIDIRDKDLYEIDSRMFGFCKYRKHTHVYKLLVVGNDILNIKVKSLRNKEQANENRLIQDKGWAYTDLLAGESHPFGRRIPYIPENFVGFLHVLYNKEDDSRHVFKALVFGSVPAHANRTNESLILDYITKQYEDTGSKPKAKKRKTSAKR